MDRGLLFLLWVWFLLVGLVLLQFRDPLFTLLDLFHQSGNFILLLFTEFCWIGVRFDLGELLFFGWTDLFTGWNLLFTRWNILFTGWTLRIDALILQILRKSQWTFQKLVPDHVFEALRHLILVGIHVVHIKVSPATDFVFLELTSHLEGEFFIYFKICHGNSLFNLFKDDTATHLAHLVLYLGIRSWHEEGVWPFNGLICLLASGKFHQMIKL